MEEKKSIFGNKKLILTLVPVLVLVVAVVGVTYAFFNYTRAGSDNSIGTGRINFVSTQSGTTSISNYFPQIPGGAQADQSSLATISVTGGTTFSGGINYYVKLIDVKVGNNAYNPSTDVPVNIDVAEVSGLTVANHGTFIPEGTNHSGVGIALSEGVVIANGTIGVADTAANSDNWINGTFTVQAYIPSNVAISDTTGEYESTAYVNGTTTTWVAGRRVLTTAQWNALSANPVTFKIQVVANEGIPPFRGTASQLASSASLYGLETTDYGKIYTGSNPDNYVWFNGEQWRILGVYGDKLKIVRATPLTQTRAYNASTSDGNAWSGSALETFLNGDYYNGVANEGLTETSRGMIAEGTWNAGATTKSATANTAYQEATGTTVSKNVGLIATYEYLYAAGESCRNTAGGRNSFSTCADQDWLKPSSLVWTLSPVSANFTHALYVGSIGDVMDGLSYYYVAFPFDVLPAVYLKSSVRITGGNGQVGSEYTLG